MAVKDSAKTYCLYCKKILSDPKEIELQYHISCKTDMDTFENDNTGIEWRLAQALGLSEGEVATGINKKEIRYILDRQNKIKELEIKDLDINNKFNDIQLFPTQLPDLQILSITAVVEHDVKVGWWKSDFQELPKNIGALKKLKILNLSGNSLKALPESIGGLTNLRELYLEYNDIQELPNSITNLVNLEILNVSYNPLKTLPDHFEDLKSLKKLLLKDNRFDGTPMFYDITLPKNFGNLPKLEELRFYYELEGLPETFMNLKNLRLLEIQGRMRSLRHKEAKLSVIDFGTLTELKELRLRSCSISPSPEFYSRMKKVEILAITDNPDYFQKQKVFDFLPDSLLRLDLRDNELKEIPEAITRLENLKFLDLRNNELTKLPEAITKLEKLLSLDLRKNSINTSIYENEDYFPFFKRTRTLI